jgi:hypothetical protein
MDVFCPRCFHATDHLKAQHVPVVVRMRWGLGWTYERFVGCPICMRRYLWWQTFRALLLGPWFPFAAVRYLYLWVVSFSAGHSDVNEAELHRRPADERFGDLGQAVAQGTEVKAAMRALLNDLFRLSIWALIAVVIGLLIVYLLTCGP